MPFIILAFLFLTGCIYIDSHLQLPNESVKPVLIGEDCTVIFLGFGVGTNRIEKALAYPLLLSDRYTKGPGPITKIRTMAITDSQFLGMGNRCVEVIGE